MQNLGFHPWHNKKFLKNYKNHLKRSKYVLPPTTKPVNSSAYTPTSFSCTPIIRESVTYYCLEHTMCICCHLQEVSLCQANGKHTMCIITLHEQTQVWQSGKLRPSLSLHSPLLNWLCSAQSAALTPAFHCSGSFIQ